MSVCGVLPDYNSRDQQQDEGVWYYLITIVVISSRMSVCGVLPDNTTRFVNTTEMIYEVCLNPNFLF